MSEEKQEAPRGFSVVLGQINDGAFHADVSEQLQTLAATLKRQAENYSKGAKGTLTITLSLSAEDNGTITIDGEVKAKAPKERKAKSLFWVTDGGNLVVDNPRQPKLPFAVVPTQAAREVVLAAVEAPRNI